MNSSRAKRERGVALLALLAVIALGASWFLVSQLNAESGGRSAAIKARNAAVLNQAKQALIGYVAAQAAKALENRPGALPCPEAPGNFNDPANEGTVAFPCTPPTVGRFPWRTLGLDKLVDASGEPLWYVVSPGWAGANTVINSNSIGMLRVDGVDNVAVALIIAPGPAFSAPAAANCNAWNQTRPTAGVPDWRNYLECQNADNPANTEFVTTGPSGAFNDQVVRITVADIMPAIEAAIAHRIEREIAPAIMNAYAAPNWGLTGSDRVYPYAAPFNDPLTVANPDTPDTASYTGAAGTTQGLLPLATQDCVAGGSPRCNTTLVSWSDAAPTVSYTDIVVPVTTACSYAGPTGFATCSGTYLGVGAAPQITVSGPQSNGAMSLRQLNAAAIGTVVFLDPLNLVTPVTVSNPLPSVALNNDGTFTVSITAKSPSPAGPGVVSYSIFVPGNATTDHSLLDATTASATGWFLRNEWHKLTYYAVAPGYTAVTVAPRSCTTLGTCLSAANVTPAGAQRAILLLAGRSINGSARPSSTLSDYLEFGNASGTFERQSVTAASASPYADTGAANAYVAAGAAPVAGSILQFRATNGNTGASTLTTPATGLRNLVNLDSSNLAASTIQANATVQVVYDGNQFLLSRRPFNDRIVAAGSN